MQLFIKLSVCEQRNIHGLHDMLHKCVIEHSNVRELEDFAHETLFNARELENFACSIVAKRSQCTRKDRNQGFILSYSTSYCVVCIQIKGLEGLPPQLQFAPSSYPRNIPRLLGNYMAHRASQSSLQKRVEFVFALSSGENFHDPMIKIAYTPHTLAASALKVYKSMSFIPIYKYSEFKVSSLSPIVL